MTECTYEVWSDDLPPNERIVLTTQHRSEVVHMAAEAALQADTDTLGLRVFAVPHVSGFEVAREGHLLDYLEAIQGPMLEAHDGPVAVEADPGPSSDPAADPAGDPVPEPAPVVVKRKRLRRAKS